MNFEKERQLKFDKGRETYDTPWELSHVDTRSEIMEELLDLYNYASLHKTKRGQHDKELARVIMRLSKGYWELFQEAGNTKHDPTENEKKLWKILKSKVMRG